MLSEGLLEEVERLCQRPGFSKELPAYRAAGYRQTIEYLKGNIQFDTLKTWGATATCQLAKRQLTWLRKWPNLTIFEANNPDLLKNTKEYIDQKLSS